MICTVILTGRGSRSPAVTRRAVVIVQRSKARWDVREVLRELLADTWGAASSTAVAGGTGNVRIEPTLHLPLLAFPAAVRAFPHLSPFGIWTGIMLRCRTRSRHDMNLPARET